MNLVPVMLENPRFLVMEIKSLYTDSAVGFVDDSSDEAYDGGGDAGKMRSL